MLPASGCRLPFGASSYRSMRITGRMMTTAGSDAPAIEPESRAARPAGRKWITVPMSLPPAPDGSKRFESHKVNAPLTPAL